MTDDEPQPEPLVQDGAAVVPEHPATTFPASGATPVGARTGAGVGNGTATLALVLAVLALLGAGAVAALVGTGTLRARPSGTVARQLAATTEHEAALERQVAALGDKLTAQNDRVAALAARPQAQPTDLGPLAVRVAALEARPVPSAGSAQDYAGMSTRVDALAGRLDALAAREQADAAAAGDKVAAAVAPLRADLSGLGGRMDAAATAERTQMTAIGARLDAAAGRGELSTVSDQVAVLDRRVAALERSTSQVTGLADRAQRLARLQSAEVALRNGQPLGAVPDAPPAVSRFATQAPPTEASLRLSFPEAAERARVVSQPQTADLPIWKRMWARVQQSVVVRRGDDVMLGDPAAGVLARAGDAVDAGDLAGAVSILGALHGGAAEAMAPWVAQARALLDARSGLAALAARA